jgi:hypothetical protein
MSGQSSFLTYVGDSGIRITLPEPVRARTSDPQTSHDAAAMLARADSHCHKILRLYAQNADGLTDAEVEATGIVKHAWKRCSDLRNWGLVAPVRQSDQIVTRPGPSGRMQQVCAITVEGWRAFESKG